MKLDRTFASFAAVARKEMLHLARDRSTLAIAIVLPLFQLVLFGFIDMTVANLPTVIVDQSKTEQSRSLIDKLVASKTFAVTVTTTDPEIARDRIVSGDARAAVVIPPDFADRRVRGESAPALVLLDGSDANVSAQALASVNGLFARESARAIGVRPSSELEVRAPAFDAHPLVLFNPAGRTANFIIPGLVAVLLQLVALVLSSMSIVRERERGTLEQLLVTPIDPLGLVLGKLAPYLVFGIAEASLILAIMRFGFDVPIRGGLVFLLVMSLVYMFSLLALGLFISTLAQTQLAAQQLAQLVFLPSIFLSGYIFPSEGLPFVLRFIGKLLPATHMIAILRGTILRGAEPRQLWTHIVALVVMSIVLVAGSALRFRKVSA